MELKKLLKNISPLEIRGNVEVNITGINIDSRKIENGDLFVAVKGTLTDGHAYINKALEKGAKAVLVCQPIPENIPEGVTFVRVENTEHEVEYYA